MNVVKVVKIVGTIVSIAGTVMTGWAGSKELGNKVAEEVAKQINKA